MGYRHRGINNYAYIGAYPKMHHEPFGNGPRPRGPVPPLHVDWHEFLENNHRYGEQNAFNHGENLQSD